MNLWFFIKIIIFWNKISQPISLQYILGPESVPQNFQICIILKRIFKNISSFWDMCCSINNLKYISLIQTTKLYLPSRQTPSQITKRNIFIYSSCYCFETHCARLFIFDTHEQYDNWKHTKIWSNNAVMKPKVSRKGSIFQFASWHIFKHVYRHCGPHVAQSWATMTFKMFTPKRNCKGNIGPMVRSTFGIINNFLWPLGLVIQEHPPAKSLVKYTSEVKKHSI